MSRAESLYRLQLLDTDLDQSKKLMRELQTALDRNPAVEHARAELDACDKVQAKTAIHVKSLELDVQSLEAKLKEEETRLYSGAVKSPKEMVDLQNELAALRRRQGESNDTLLTAMLELDEAQADTARCKSLLAEAMERWEGDRVALRKQLAALADRTTASQERRTAICAAVPPGDISLYDTLRAKKSNNVAVAPVKGKACGQCGEAPSSMQVQQARGDALVMCPNCGRILYAG